jgi:phosphatidylserine decarboxylase
MKTLVFKEAKGLTFAIISFIIIFFFIKLFSNAFLIQIFLLFGIIFFIFLIFFFRDPERKIVYVENTILSPADGKVISIENNYENGFNKISIFLSIFDVHIQRAPIPGIIKSIDYVRGKFYPANKKNSAYNEKNVICIKNEDKEIKIIQIAGSIARRIVTWVNTNNFINAGDKIGMIKFGSRVEIYIPIKFKINVKINDKVKAGKTVIATL